MVKDHSDSEKGNLLPPHRLLLSINSKGSFFYMHHPTDRITHTAAFVTPVVEHWLEWEIAQWVHPMEDWSDDPLHHERTLYLWATSCSPVLSDTHIQYIHIIHTLYVHYTYIPATLLHTNISPVFLNFLCPSSLLDPLCCVSDHRSKTQTSSCTVEANAELQAAVVASTGKEGSVLFNDTLNTFYLRLYGVRHMVKDHSDSERGNPLPPHGLLFLVNSKGSFICIIPQTG